jgi:integrase
MLAAFVGCMLYAGLRVSEVCNLDRDDVDLDNGAIYIRRGKGGRPRAVGISSALRARLVDYLALRQQGEKFFTQVHGQGYTRTSMAQRMIKLSRQTGFHVTCHGLRRTFATLAASQGRSVNSIRIALGHSKLDTTQAYLRTSEAEVVEAMKNW